MVDFFLAPFLHHAAMQQALVACLALSLGAAPLGIFLVLRRLSLASDALSHAILPGVAVAWLIYDHNPTAMIAGGLISGLFVAFMAGMLSRKLQMEEDASFTSVYVLSVATGVLVASAKGDVDELLHVLFGNVMHIEHGALVFIAGAASFSLFTLALAWRGLVIEWCDPLFLKTVKGGGGWLHQLFLLLLVFNLVAAYQVVGTLLSVGLLVLPALSMRLWVESIGRMAMGSAAISFLSSGIGLLCAYHTGLPAGPSIVLCAGVVYVFSLCFGTYGGLIRRFRSHTHLEA